MEEKIWKMIALDVSEWTIIIFQNGACTVCQINGGPCAIKHTKNALITQIQTLLFKKIGYPY